MRRGRERVKFFLQSAPMGVFVRLGVVPCHLAQASTVGFQRKRDLSMLKRLVKVLLGA